MDDDEVPLRLLLERTKRASVRRIYEASPPVPCKDSFDGHGQPARGLKSNGRARRGDIPSGSEDEDDDGGIEEVRGMSEAAQGMRDRPGRDEADVSGEDAWPLQWKGAEEDGLEVDEAEAGEEADAPASEHEVQEVEQDEPSSPGGVTLVEVEVDEEIPECDMVMEAVAGQASTDAADDGIAMDSAYVHAHADARGGAAAEDPAMAEALAVAAAAEAAEAAEGRTFRMVTRKRDISHLTAVLKDNSIPKSQGRGSRKAAPTEDGGGGSGKKVKRRTGGGKGTRRGGGKKGSRVNQDLMPDWLLNPGGHTKQQGPAADEDIVRMSVAPKDFEVEDAEGKPVVLSKVHKGSSMQLSDDLLAVTSWKGYRMIRATRGVQDGAWYFEISVEHLGKTGHARLGWTSSRGDVQAPVGFDSHSFAYRDLDGSKVFEAWRSPYAESYSEGDVIGCYIHLPRGDTVAPKTRPVVIWKRQPFYVEDAQEGKPIPVPGSEVVFYKNGVCMGTAFREVTAERYFPAASLYTLPEQTEGATVRFNFGPEFQWVPTDWGEGRPAGQPMCLAKAVDPSEHLFDPEQYKSETAKKKLSAEWGAEEKENPRQSPDEKQSAEGEAREKEILLQNPEEKQRAEREAGEENPQQNPEEDQSAEGEAKGKEGPQQNPDEKQSAEGEVPERQHPGDTSEKMHNEEKNGRNERGQAEAPNERPCTEGNGGERGPGSTKEKGLAVEGKVGEVGFSEGEPPGAQSDQVDPSVQGLVMEPERRPSSLGPGQAASATDWMREEEILSAAQGQESIPVWSTDAISDQEGNAVLRTGGTECCHSGSAAC